MINYEAMSLDELKEIAKDKGMKIGNIGKDKLISKLMESDNVSSIIGEDDDFINENEPEKTEENVNHEGSKSLLESINDTLDDLDSNEDKDITDEKFVPLSPDTVVPVRSITFGQLIYRSPSNNAPFLWNRIGDIREMTIAEISEMNNTRPDFLTKPRVILLNETAIKQFRLTEVYENVAQINNLKTLFKKSDDEISRAIDSALMCNMRDVVISKVRTMYKNKTLTDINVIKLLKNKLQFDLTDD